MLFGHLHTKLRLPRTRIAVQQHTNALLTLLQLLVDALAHLGIEQLVNWPKLGSGFIIKKQHLRGDFFWCSVWYRYLLRFQQTLQYFRT